MNQCKTCKHWRVGQVLDSVYDEDGDYAYGEWSTTWGECALTVMSRDELDHPDTLARGRDASGYAALLETHETFGCVQWEESDG